jgi:hypothetical protein
MAPCCINCDTVLDGNYLHWPIKKPLWCGVCFEMLLVVFERDRVKDAQRSFLAGNASD